MRNYHLTTTRIEFKPVGCTRAYQYTNTSQSINRSIRKHILYAPAHLACFSEQEMLDGERPPNVEDLPISNRRQVRPAGLPGCRCFFSVAGRKVLLIYDSLFFSSTLCYST